MTALLSSPPRTAALTRPWVAIDFETANHQPTSACAVGVVRVEGGKVVAREKRLIRPGTTWFQFTFVHGLDAAAVAEAARFEEVWAELEPLLEGAAWLVAHNARFDRRVVEACCAQAGLGVPGAPWICSMRLAQERWALSRRGLPAVCAHLGLPLVHHDPLSDAEAAAGIVLAACGRQGTRS